MKLNKNVLVGAGVVVLVAGSYLVGQASDSRPTSDTAIHATASTSISSQTENGTQQSTPVTWAQLQAKYPPQTPTGAGVNIRTNSAPCEQIAMEAAQNDQAETDSKGYSNNTTVSEAYYTHLPNLSDGCFYELVTKYTSGVNAGTVVTSIDYAPDDKEFAECTNSPSGTSCSQEGFGSVSQSTFQLAEAELFAN